MPSIIVSYRREDSKWITGRIVDRLERDYGQGQVFVDIDAIPFGMDFRDRLRHVLDRCDILLAIIGPNWLAPGVSDQARIHDPADWVRIEIETALANRIPVIPVLIDRAPMPEPSDLPESMRELAYRQAADVDSGRDFHVHMDRLIRAISKSGVGQSSVVPADSDQVELQLRSLLAQAPSVRELEDVERETAREPPRAQPAISQAPRSRPADIRSRSNVAVVAVGAVLAVGGAALVASLVTVPHTPAPRELQAGSKQETESNSPTTPVPQTEPTPQTESKPQTEQKPQTIPDRHEVILDPPKAVLYEEDANDPQGKRYVGSAIWRAERVAGPNRQTDIAIRADVAIPDRKLAATWSLRLNLDRSLPATHLVEIIFRLPQDFAPGGVSNVPGILMKATEQTRGVPLAGLAVKVSDSFFLIRLSASDADRERNLQMLKERQWFDMPVVYKNNLRGIVAFEKGTTGDRAFAEAFAAWRQ